MIECFEETSPSTLLPDAITFCFEFQIIQTQWHWKEGVISFPMISKLLQTDIKGASNDYLKEMTKNGRTMSRKAKDWSWREIKDLRSIILIKST
jgi:hypothetical protein